MTGVIVAGLVVSIVVALNAYLIRANRRRAEHDTVQWEDDQT